MTEEQARNDEQISEIKDSASRPSKVKPVNIEQREVKIHPIGNLSRDLVTNVKRADKTAQSSPKVTQSELVGVVGFERMNSREEEE